MPNPAKLPAHYEKMVRAVETCAPEDGTLNKKNSWARVRPELHTAAVALLKYHMGATHLRSGRYKIFHARWTDGVLRHILDATDTCLDRAEEGLQCNEHVPDGENSGLCLGHRHQNLLAEASTDRLAHASLSCISAP